MPKPQRVVTFTAKGRKALEDFVRHGKKSARAITRADVSVVGQREEGVRGRQTVGGLAGDDL